jgi:hypothetical protein
MHHRYFNRASRFDQHDTHIIGIKRGEITQSIDHQLCKNTYSPPAYFQ